MTTSDNQLLERARQYDAQALAEIYDCYSGQIYGYLYRYVGDAQHAEDLTSDVFLRLLQVLNTPREPHSQLQGWLYRVAHNLAMDWFRHQSKQSLLEAGLEQTMVADVDPPSTMVEKQQLRWRLRRALRELTRDQQQVILLRFGEGYRIAEVSRLMNKSEGAVKILQHRAIKRLRTLLDATVR